jgi:hypothetical protein
MNPIFHAKFSPTMEEISEIESLTPYSLFNTSIYAEACKKIGEVPCLFVLKDDTKVMAGCLGFFSKTGFLWRELMIYSAPNISYPGIFWAGVRDFCKKKWNLGLGY